MATILVTLWSQWSLSWSGIGRGSLMTPLAQASPGDISDLVIWGLLAVLLAIIVLVVTRTLRPKKPPIGAQRQEALPREEGEAQAEPGTPPGEHLPSLREIKASRAVKVTDELKTKEAIFRARQARKGATRQAIEGVDKATDASPLQGEPAPDEVPPEERPLRPARIEPVSPPPVLPDQAGKPVEAVEREKPVVVAKEAPPARPVKSLEEGLSKTRSGFVRRLKGLFAKRTQIDGGLMTELEEVLFTADIGVKTSQLLLEKVQEKMRQETDFDPQRAWGLLRRETQRILETNQKPLHVGDERPVVILVIGVNGVGKTTTIGKLASRFKAEGHKVLLVAADTFRAAASDQLAIWGERVGCPVFTAPEGRDPSSVVYDAIKVAVKEGYDVVVADTAGRLHTKVNLIEELKKVHRVSNKALPGAPHHVLLVLDANTGQNAIAQAQMFNQEVGITGIVLTKLDGTAKGGVVIGISDELGVPVQYIGIGEQIEDLREFNASDFAEAIFS